MAKLESADSTDHAHVPYAEVEKGVRLRIGGAKIPFCAAESLIALSFDFRSPQPALVRDFLKDFQQRFSNADVPFTIVEAKNLPKALSESLFPAYFLLLFDVSQRLRVMATLRQELLAWQNLHDGTFRIGTPISVSNKWKTFLDRYFIVRFNDHAEQEKRQHWIDRYSVKVIRRLSSDAKLLRIELSTDDYLASLDAIEAGIETQVLDIGDPDFLFTILPQGYPDTWPNDPRYLEQNASPASTHGVQKVRQAWQLLSASKAQFSSVIPPSSPNVYIGLIDEPIDANHPELNCKLADGSDQVSTWIHGRDIADCRTQPMYCPCPTSGHGMAAATIASACTNNGQVGQATLATACTSALEPYTNSGEIAAIAPGAHLIIAGVPTTSSPEMMSTTQYSELLMWMAGRANLCPVTQTCPTLPEKCPNNGSAICLNPPNPGATLISNSYSGNLISNAPEPVVWTVIDSAITSVSIGDTANNHPPVLLIYAAGNGVDTVEEDSGGDLYFAGHRKTFAIANCTVRSDPSTSRVIVRLAQNDCWEKASNSGPKVDLCAIGHNAATTDVWCTLTAPIDNSPVNGSCPPRTATCSFGGTSAATPTVAGAIALMLTANPQLTPGQVRTILHESSLGNSSIQFDEPTISSRLLNVCSAVKRALALASGTAPDGIDYCEERCSAASPYQCYVGETLTCSSVPCR